VRVCACVCVCVWLCAAVVSRDPFVLPLDKKQAADEAKRSFAGGTCSDHLALLRAYQVWRETASALRPCTPLVPVTADAHPGVPLHSLSPPMLLFTVCGCAGDRDGVRHLDQGAPVLLVNTAGETFYP
jgi:hypothetical protein